MKIKTKIVAQATLIISLYLVLGFIFQNISFGQIQVRLADILYPIISLGTPFLIGAFLGHFIFNIYGFTIGLALGIGDILSPFLLLIPKLLIWKFGKRKIGLLITTLLHTIIVSLWVSWLLYIMFNLSMIISIPLIFSGEFVAEILLGVPITLTLKKILK